MADAYLKFKQAVSAVVPKSLVRAVVSRMPDKTVTRAVPHVDGQLAFGLRRHHWLMSDRCFEGHGTTLGLFKYLARDGDIFYDVGGNIGYYARWSLANLPIKKLIAFEPMAANLTLLRQNQSLAKRSADFEVLPIALSDRDGSTELQTDDQSDGSAALSRVTGGAASDARAQRGLAPLVETVDERRLDALLFEESDVQLPPPSLIKVDTEGAEHLVLGGATRTLREFRPRLILATHGTERGNEMLQTLHEADYAVAGWCRGEGGPVWRRLSPGDAGQMADNNCCAAPDAEDLEETPPVLELGVGG